MGIPLRLLMALTIALVAIITAVVCFAPTYLAGVDSVLSTVENLRTNLVTLASERITAYFAKPRDLSLLMGYNSERGRLDSSNLTAMTQLSCDIAFDNVGVFTGVSFILVAENTFLRCDTTNLLTKAFGGTPGIVLLSPDGSLIQGFRIDNVTHAAIPGTKYFETAFPVGTPVWLTSPVTVALVTNPTINTVWVDTDLSWDATRTIVGSKLAYPNGTFRGAITFDISSIGVMDFLRSLGLREGGRAIAWNDNSGFTIGLSWDEPAVLLSPLWQDLTLPASARGSLRMLDNFTDPLIRRVLATVGSFPALRALPVPYASRIGSGEDVVFVDVVGIRDAYGLNVKILIAMPQIDFLRDVYKQQVRTLAGVCSGVAVMIALAFLIGHLMAAPLKRLAERMELTASFDDDEEDDPLSALAEVASMQQSYVLMKGQLNRAKTFLPQSVVARDDGEEADDGATQSAGLAESGIRSPSESIRGSVLSNSDNKTSRSSRRNTKVSNGVVVAGGLNVNLGVTLRCVSVVAFNLRGFLRTAAASARRSAEVQEAMLATVHRAVRENKGVVDYFQGDRILASFNACTNTVAHGRRAIVAVVNALRELREQSTVPLQASAGISQGMALCGNMGTEAMRRFSIVGHVVTQAVVLERLTKLYSGVSTLMPGWMETDAQLEFYYQTVDLVRLPGGGQKLDDGENRSACLLLAPIRTKQVAQDEWMYELKSGDEANPFHHVNSGFRALLTGDVSAAKTALAARVASDADAVGAANLADHIAKASESADAKVLPKDLGLYYQTVMPS